MRTTRALAAFGAAFLAAILGGCCDPDKETCKIVQARALRLADTITICCGLGDAAARDACLEDVTKTSDALEDIIRQARQACRDENWRRAKELLDELEKKWKEWERTHPAVVPIPSLPGGSGNASAPVGSSETFLFSFSAAPADAVVTPVVETSEGTYLPEAVGPALVASGSALIASVSPSEIVSTPYTLGQGATIAWNTGGETLTYTVSGSLSLGAWDDPNNDGGTAIPTGLDLTLTRGQLTVQVTLDAAYPGNLAVRDKAGAGHIRAAVHLTVKDPLGFAPLTPVGRLWIDLQFSTSGQSLNFASAGPRLAPAVLPATAEAYAEYDHDFVDENIKLIAAAGACDDADGNGRPDAADTIIRNAKELFPECFPAPH